jgi:cytidylate kinase
MSTPQVIAMDGPAASGKSSVAREVASRLGWTFVNTGNTYRAATWAVLQSGVDPNDSEAVRSAVSTADITCVIEQGRSVVRVGGREVEDELNSQAVNGAVSLVARVPEVREKLVAMQRALGRAYPVVMEGRDIGTVVFPDAPAKFYIDASEEVRAKRRGLQGHSDSVRERDRLDTTRKNAPLMAASDAIVIDSSHLTLAQVVDTVMETLRARGVGTAADREK